jgi:drug/metabolite transporter (DMT)-like permease
VSQETAGIALAVASAAMYSIGFVIEKRATRRLPEIHIRQTVQMVTTLFRDPLWIVGFLLLGCGLLTQVLALSLAPITIVQPLSVSGIVLLLILSHFFLGDRLGRAEYLGITAILCALIVLGLSVDHHEDAVSATTSLARVLEVGLPAVAFAFGLFVLADRIKGTNVRTAHLKAPLFGMSSGLMYGVAALGVKEVSTIVKHDGLVRSVPHDLASPGLYLMLATTVIGFLIFQTALQRTTASVFVPVNTVASSGYFIIAGTVLFHERLPSTIGPLLLRSGAFALTLMGLFFLTMSKKNDISPELHDALEIVGPEDTEPDPVAWRRPDGVTIGKDKLLGVALSTDTPDPSSSVST